MNYFKILLPVTLIFALIGCASTPKTSNIIENQPPDKMYESGKAALNNNNYKTAIDYFNAMQVYHPDEDFSQQALLELAYTYYKAQAATSAIATADHFINTYPKHNNTDYAYYLRGLTSFDQAIGNSDISAKGSQSKPLMAKIALQYFSELKNKYPNSKYSKDATQRIKYLNDKLAQHEVLLAKYYTDQGSYASAALHAKSAIENFPETPSATEAVKVSNMAYSLLGIPNKIVGQNNISNKNLVNAKEKTNRASKAKVIWPKENSTKKSNTPVAVNLPQNAAPEEKQNNAPLKTITLTASKEDNGIKMENWILAQDPDAYTLQVMGTNDKSGLINLIKKHQIQNEAAFLQKQVQNKPWFSLIFGSYESRTEAVSAVSNLPSALNKNKPWIRQFSALQKDINLTRTLAGN